MINNHSQGSDCIVICLYVLRVLFKFTLLYAVEKKLTKTQVHSESWQEPGMKVFFTVIVKDGITILSDTGKCIWWATQRIFLMV